MYYLYKSLPKCFYPFFLKRTYKARTGHTLNLKNPKRFSEKIQWLKLYDNLPIKETLTDKLKVRDWVNERIPSIEFPEIYGVWNSFEEIDFDILPDAFYLKTNHGCGMNIRIEDKKRFLKEGKEEVSKIFKNWLNTNFAFKVGFEMQYKNISPKIFAEERILAQNNIHVRVSDYKILCFHGEAKYIEYFVYPPKSKPSDARLAIYDKYWNKQPFTHSRPIYEGELPKPDRLDEMINIAETLSKDFKMVRVDFVENEGKLYFAEMTFTPCSGHMLFEPDEYDFKIGDMLDLNK